MWIQHLDTHFFGLFYHDLSLYSTLSTYSQGKCLNFIKHQKPPIKIRNPTTHFSTIISYLSNSLDQGSDLEFSFNLLRVPFHSFLYIRCLSITLFLSLYCFHIP